MPYNKLISTNRTSDRSLLEEVQELVPELSDLARKNLEFIMKEHDPEEHALIPARADQQVLNVLRKRRAELNKYYEGLENTSTFAVEFWGLYRMMLCAHAEMRESILARFFSDPEAFFQL